MSRRSLASLVVTTLLAAVCLAPATPALCQKGYTGADLERMGQWLQFYQLDLYRLEIPNYASPYAAALTSGKHGWRIVVFLRDGGVTNVDWDSGFLKRPFQAASTDNFVLIPRVGTNFGVSFSGYDAQNCASDYGALLYLPWSHQFFQKEVAAHSVACSQSLLDPRNAAALQALDAALTRQQAPEPHYAPPPCPGMRTSAH
jgi:hypothetical protein